MHQGGGAARLREGQRLEICRRGVLVCASFLLLSLTSYFLLRSGHRAAAATQVQPVVILKLPRSGSSWLVERLNNLPSVYILKEAMQGSDVGGYSHRDIEGHFIRALSGPADKISRSKSLLPSGRYFEDYLLHRSGKALQPSSRLGVIGFSLNIEHCTGLSWARVVAEVPRLKVVLLRRRNVVKMALSAKSGEALKRLCGGSNIRKDEKSLQCFETYKQSSKQITWGASEFIADVNFWLNRTAAFADAVAADPHLSSLQQSVLFYESLQTNFAGAVGGLFHSLGRGFSAADGALLEREGGDSWSKRSGEDLGEIVANYDELVALLSGDGSCRCLLQQLQSTKISNKVEICSTKQLTHDEKSKSVTCA